MERDSFVYKMRRKMQVIAYHILPHDILSKLYFKIFLNEHMDLKNPKKFNEKLQWLKLNYYSDNPLVIKCTDKYTVRNYVKECGYSSILTNLIGVWDCAEDINWDSLPEKFVLKCTHGCAYNLICENKSTFDKNQAVKQLNTWLKENFAAFNVELHYGKIKSKKIICEEYLGDSLVDYKFFCFSGEPRFFYVSSDLIHDRQAKIGFFNLDGSKIPMVRDDYEDIGNIEMPKCISDMLEVSRSLSKNFPFVRVDFFLVDDTYKFAELTFTPGACMMPLNPKKYDIEWGEMLKLPRK